MAHTVTVRIPDRPISHKDIVFKVRKNGDLFGRLKVSQGAVVWLPGKTNKGWRLSWDKLAAAARDYGRRGNYPV